MVDRKETPDVLGEILGGAAPASSPSETLPGGEKPVQTPRAPRNAPRKRRRSPTKPPKWEYMEVVFRDYRGWRPRFVNGNELSDWRNEPIMHDYLNQIGAKGWELVDMEKRRWYEKVAYFKRQST